MNLLPLIHKKREGEALGENEISSFVQSLTSKNPPPDYQIASLLAFIVANGMTSEETFSLTNAMRLSGKPFQYKGFPSEAVFVDKHSTGGVGDKITLPLAPLVVSCHESIFFPTIAGRGLGHTGGTVDKLESIPGFKCGLDMNAFYKVLKKNRMAFLSQTPKIAPADRILYALRDVTGTVASIPLITASILSKKLSESLHYLLIDLKVGSGAFLRDSRMSDQLADQMLNVLKQSGVGARICMTSMDTPLGLYSGNLWEVKESIDILQGKGPARSSQLTKELAQRLLSAANISEERANSLIASKINSGEAYAQWERAVIAQGGSLKKLAQSFASISKMKSFSLKASQSGYLRFDVTGVGMALGELGGGRLTKKDKIDPWVGFYHPLETGAKIESGDEIVRIFYRDKPRLNRCLLRLKSAVVVQDEPISKIPLIVKDLT